MSAYVIADVQLTGDVGEVEQYRAGVQATLEPYGGRFLVRGGAYEVIEGDWQPGRIVVLEFPSAEAAHEWNDSAAYQAIAPLRTRNMDSKRLIVEGATGDTGATGAES
ncbi:DUF1330 domain-containing protein [Streptomyces natalensis]|uniref:DUF1330 domain-containing protein n=1 Tax=Streptomyces natalensis TaxID=68242 RepID=UPI0005C89D80|nr:DUF1330 domain-containing protein [Streptomyces natalensis]